jgi:YggT family protein
VPVVLDNLALSLEWLLRFVYVVLVVRVIASFVPPRHPGWWTSLADLTRELTDPILHPVRRYLPLWGGMDFSPVVALLLADLLGSVAVQALVWVAQHV